MKNRCCGSGGRRKSSVVGSVVGSAVARLVGGRESEMIGSVLLLLMSVGLVLLLPRKIYGSS